MIYKITHKQYNGCAYLLFDKEVLSTLHYEFKPMPTEQVTLFKRVLPVWEKDCQQVTEPFTIQQIPVKTAREKVMLFCHWYKFKNPHNARKATYTAKQTDFSNIKKYVVNEAFLKTYFEQSSFPFTPSKSITDFIRLYNEVRRITMNGNDEQMQFPNSYDAAFEKRLKPDELSAYWKHLRQLGYERKQVGTVTRWEKTTLL